MNQLKKVFFSLLKKELFWMILILIGAFVVRLYKVDNPVADWHSWRQADTASVSRVFVKDGIDLFLPRYHDVSSIQSGILNLKGYRLVELPLYNAIHALLAKTFVQFSLEVWGRLTSIIFSLFSTYFLFLLGKRFLGKLGGILSAFFFAFIPYNIYFSRVILPEPMATAVALFSIVVFVRYLDKNSLFAFYFSAIFLSLSMLIKPHTVFYLVPMIYLFVKKHSLKELVNAKRVIHSLLYVLILITPFFLWRIWINNFPQGIPFFEWSFNGDHIRFRPAFWRWLFAERLGKLILGIWGILPFSLGVIYSFKKNSFVRFFLLGMFLYMATFASANVRHDYYQIFLVPSVSLALAQGCLFLLNMKKDSLISYSVLLFSILMMLGVGAYQVKDYYQINHPEIIQAGKAIDNLVPKDALVIAPYNGDTAFLYQTNRWGWPAVDNSFDKIIKRGATYYVTVTPNDADSLYIRKYFTLVAETDLYFIADLTKPIKP